MNFPTGVKNVMIGSSHNFRSSDRGKAVINPPNPAPKIRIASPIERHFFGVGLFQFFVPKFIFLLIESAYRPDVSTGLPVKSIKTFDKSLAQGRFLPEPVTESVYVNSQTP